MDIGISYWFGFPSFPEERAALIKQAGFSNVSLHWTNEYKRITGDKYSIPRVLEKNHISISSLHLSFEQSHFLWDPDEEGMNYRKEVKRSVDDAHLLGVNIIVMHSDGILPAKSQMKSILDDLLEYAEKWNVFLCLENLQQEDNLKQILAVEAWKKIPLCFDLGHANIRTSPINCVNNKNIHYFHIHDNDGRHDSHDLPFSGTIDWKERTALLKTYQDVPQILEVHGHITRREMAERYLFQAKRIALAIRK